VFLFQDLLDSKLTTNAKELSNKAEEGNPEETVEKHCSLVFYLKMQGDYYRYLCEVMENDEKKGDSSLLLFISKCGTPCCSQWILRCF